MAVLFEQTTQRVHGHYEPGYNLANHVDFQYLPGRLYDRYYDPEGILRHSARDRQLSAGIVRQVFGCSESSPVPRDGPLLIGVRVVSFSSGIFGRWSFPL